MRSEPLTGLFAFIALRAHLLARGLFPALYALSGATPKVAVMVPAPAVRKLKQPKMQDRHGENDVKSSNGIRRLITTTTEVRQHQAPIPLTVRTIVKVG